MPSRLFVEHRYQNLGQRLAYLDVHLAAQGEHHRGDALGDGHRILQFPVYQGGVGRGESAQVYGIPVFSAHGIQVAEQPVGHEGRKGCHEPGNGFEAGVERLVGGQFVGAHAAAPKAFAVQSYVPVGKVLADELLNEACCRRGVEILQSVAHLSHECVEQRDYPPVNFGAFGHGYFRFLTVEAVYVGIEGEETVGVVERTEKFAPYFIHPFRVELEIVPRLRIGYHVPAHGVRPVFIHYVERVYGVAEPLAHFVAVFVEHQTVGDDVPEGDRIEEHGGQSM